jgi:hypothetical protein
MKAFCEAKARKQRQKELHVRIKEMHTRMRKTEEEGIEKQEEELRLRGNNWRNVRKGVVSFYCRQQITHYVQCDVSYFSLAYYVCEDIL